MLLWKELLKAILEYLAWNQRKSYSSSKAVIKYPSSKDVNILTSVFNPPFVWTHTT